MKEEIIFSKEHAEFFDGHLLGMEISALLAYFHLNKYKIHDINYWFIFSFTCLALSKRNMINRLKFMFLGIALAMPACSFGQTQDSYEYNSEFTWGINKNSAGGLIGGFTFKKARRIRPNLLETFGLEIMNVKNPQEVRLQSQATGDFSLWSVFSPTTSTRPTLLIFFRSLAHAPRHRVFHRHLPQLAAAPAAR